MGNSPETLVKWDIDRPWISSRRLAERLFKTKSFPGRYRRAVTHLMKEHFTEKKLFDQIAAFEKAISPHISKDEIGKGIEGMRMGINGDGNGINKSVGRRVFAIKPFIQKRIVSVNGQLDSKVEGVSIQVRKRRPR